MVNKIQGRLTHSNTWSEFYPSIIEISSYIAGYVADKLGNNNPVITKYGFHKQRSERYPYSETKIKLGKNQFLRIKVYYYPPNINIEARYKDFSFSTVLHIPRSILDDSWIFRKDNERVKFRLRVISNTIYAKFKMYLDDDL